MSHPVLWSNIEGFPLPIEKMIQAFVAAQNTFGHAGGSGRKKDISCIIDTYLRQGNCVQVKIRVRSNQTLSIHLQGLNTQS